MWTSEVARRAGVNPQTLRYYERRGILPEPERTPSGYRDYPDSAVNLVRFVKQGQDLGYSLDDLRQLLRLGDGRASSCAEARAITATRMDVLDRKIAELRQMRSRLADLGARCQGPGPGQLCRAMVQAVEAIDGSIIERDYDLCACSAGG